jgi:hypothetical protein
MASIEEELLAELRISRQTKTCPMPDELKKLDHKVRAKLKPFLEDAAYPKAAMLRVLKRRGLVVSEKALDKHRAKECTCYAGES